MRPALPLSPWRRHGRCATLVGDDVAVLGIAAQVALPVLADG